MFMHNEQRLEKTGTTYHTSAILTRKYSGTLFELNMKYGYHFFEFHVYPAQSKSEKLGPGRATMLGVADDFSMYIQL